MEKQLNRINKPGDMKDMSLSELEALSGEIRSLIIDTVSKTGGHLAANLGVVELTVAMMKVFNPPKDKIVWDVSHQSYAYKILTERKGRFESLRQYGGISGFIKRDESEYDAFGAGHSGTAVSAALGMAVARDRLGENHSVIAVVGDGSAGCGITYEGLNNVHGATKKFIVILNDNEMSISANVGAMSRHLGRLLASPRYNRWKGAMEGLALKLRMGWSRSIYFKLEEAIKSLFLRSVIFEEMGLRYIGPIDGHNMDDLIDALTIARDSDRPIVVHVSTEKGRGYKPAEQNPEKWHSASSFDIESGDPLSEPGKPDYSRVFGDVLTELAGKDDRIIAITAAMPRGTGLSEFAEKFPDRFFDVGISEEHAVVFAAGLAAGGYKPVFAVYSTFLQRAVDGVIHDVCLQKLPVVFCLDRAGVVGEDGPTHHGVFDIPLLASIPNLTIMQPGDEAELGDMLFAAVELGKPAVIRYPRGQGPGVVCGDKREKLEIGRAKVVKNPETDGRKVWIWALGDMLPLADETASALEKEGIGAGVVNARFIRPLDIQLLKSQFSDTSVFVTMENGALSGGFGSIVIRELNDMRYKGSVVTIGWPDEFIPQGNVKILKKKFGMDSASIVEKVKKSIE